MRASLVALIAALSTPAAADDLTYLGTTEWGFDAANGVSGLEMSDDGLSFQAVSDRGWYILGALKRDGDAISIVTVTRIAPLLGHDGFPVTARRVGDWSDAEGLAILPDGTAYVSFERWAHVSRYADLRGKAELTRDHPTFYDYAENRQLEAVAVDPDGTVYAFPEQTGPGRSGLPVYRLTGNEWEIAGEISASGGFGIVGADYDDEGRLYLLERKLCAGPLAGKTAFAASTPPKATAKSCGPAPLESSPTLKVSPSGATTRACGSRWSPTTMATRTSRRPSWNSA